jgi:hypothetical protein
LHDSRELLAVFGEQGLRLLAADLAAYRVQVRDGDLSPQGQACLVPRLARAGFVSSGVADEQLPGDVVGQGALPREDPEQACAASPARERGTRRAASLRIDASRGDRSEIETLWLAGDLRDDDFEDYFIDDVIGEGTDGWEFSGDSYAVELR